MDDEKLLAHERQRLHALVDAFIDGFTDAKVPDGYSDFRIDSAGIVMILVSIDDDDDEVETAWSHFETKRPYQKIGMLYQCIEQISDPA